MSVWVLVSALRGLCTKVLRSGTSVLKICALGLGILQLPVFLGFSSEAQNLSSLCELYTARLSGRLPRFHQQSYPQVLWVSSALGQ
jgi:hypothetical protein